MWHKQTSQAIVNNRLRLKTSIDCIRYLTFQGCTFRGHDEGPDSKNRGNFSEIIKLISNYREYVANVVLEKAPGNANYTSPQIQKEILGLLSFRVQRAIREEIDDAKYYIIIDEAHDESRKEQVAIVIRFVDKDGFIRERFFVVIHVLDTSCATLKKEISEALSKHNLNVQDIRGQRYDGASNMQGE